MRHELGVTRNKLENLLLEKEQAEVPLTLSERPPETSDTRAVSVVVPIYTSSVAFR